MKAMSFPARFDGTCTAQCDMRIHAGDQITEDGNGGYVHAACVPSPISLGPHEVVCGVCWLTDCRC